MKPKELKYVLRTEKNDLGDLRYSAFEVRFFGNLYRVSIYESGAHHPTTTNRELAMQAITGHANRKKRANYTLVIDEEITL